LTDEEGTFLTRNGKKFVTVIAGGLCLTGLAALGKVDTSYVILYWFSVGGVSAGAISRS